MIETDRLILRPWRDPDRAPFAAMNADPAIVADLPGVMTRRESDDLVDHFTACWAEDGFSYAAIERKCDGVFLGMAGLAWCRFDAPVCPCFEIGWSLDRLHWGQGYATEAARGWLDHGFSALDLPEIVAFTDRANVRSLAVMRRIGMRADPARNFDHPDLPEGHPVRPHLLFALSRAEWSAR